MLFSRNNGERIYRQSETIHYSVTGKRCGYRIVMTEPVLQGYLEPGNTEILVLPPTDAPAQIEGNGPDAKRSARKVSQAHYDVDEDFLAASVMGGLDGPSGPALNGFSPSALSPIASPSLRSDKSQSIPSALHSRSRTIAIQALRNPVDTTTLQPVPPVDEDDETQVFVRTSDLGRLGLFSGTYVGLA